MFQYLLYHSSARLTTFAKAQPFLISNGNRKRRRRITLVLSEGMTITVQFHRFDYCTFRHCCTSTFAGIYAGHSLY